MMQRIGKSNVWLVVESCSCPLGHTCSLGICARTASQAKRWTSCEYILYNAWTGLRLTSSEDMLTRHKITF